MHAGLKLALAIAVGCAVFGGGTTVAQAADDLVVKVPTANRTSLRAIDPARTRTTITWMVEYQTCANLYNHPDVDRANGGRAQPEVATDWPVVSNGGLTYTFTLRSGFAFSDGTPVTPSAYAREIERVKAFPEARQFAVDIVSAVADDVANTLTITLDAPHADIVDRLAMPYFCPVPPGTPTSLVGPLPDSGPYMRAPLGPVPAEGGTSLTLVRNPHYGGSRPRNPAQIDFVFTTAASLLYSRTNDGTYDAAVGLAAADYAVAGSQWGPGSANAQQGRQRFFVEVADAMRFLHLNAASGRRLNDVRLRQAVNHLLDRPAVTQVVSPYAETPWSQILPPSLPGFTNSPYYSAAGANLAAAQALVGETGLPLPIPLTLLAGSDPTAAPIVTSLENGGLFDVTMTTGDFDMALGGWLVDYFDPANVIVPLMHRDNIPNGGTGPQYNYSYFDSDAWFDTSGNTWTQRFDAASAAPAPLRYDMFDAIARELAPVAPIAPISHFNWRVFVADRMGCVTVHPVYQLALGTLCAPPADPTTTAARETVDADGTVATTGDATSSDPVTTSVMTPVAGTVTITESSTPTEVAPANYSFLGQQVTIEAPPASAAAPLAMTFTLDASLLPSGQDASTVQVFRDGVAIDDCAPDAGSSAAPDPCVASRVPGTDGDAVLTVRTSHASRWNFGTRAPYAHTGFFPPVDNQPVVNVAKAGSAIPVKFRLGGDQGLGVFAAGYPRVAVLSSCSGGSPDVVEETTSSSRSFLAYDAAAGTYTYTWKTEKAWANSCRELVLRFDDGSFRRATFNLTK